MTAAPVDTAERVLKSAECRRGTVTLTRDGRHYAIVGLAADRWVFGAPQKFEFSVELCDCRTNPESPRLFRSSARTSACSCASQLDAKPWCACHENLGTRPLCAKAPRHNATCHHKMDHCASGWHAGDAEQRIGKIFDAVVASYR